MVKLKVIICGFAILFFFTSSIQQLCAAGVASRLHEFAQVADGIFPGGIFKTTLILINPNPVDSQVSIRLRQSDGSPMEFTIGNTTASTFNLTLPPRGSARLQTSGTSPTLRAGWAQIEASVDIWAIVLFQIFDSSGRLISDASVEGTSILNRITDGFSIPVQEGGGTSTGVAIANISPDSTARIRMRLINNRGEEVRAIEITLPPSGHIARFIPELFTDIAVLDGSLEVELVEGFSLSAVALRITGFVMGTFSILEFF